MLTFLRGWIGLVAAIALVNAVQCFLDQQFPKTRIYDLQPSEGMHRTIVSMTGPSSPHTPTNCFFFLQPHNFCLECLESGHC